MFAGVPIIVLPVFGEQDYNAHKLHYLRRGIKIELRNLRQQDLDNAISSILTDPSYRKNMGDQWSCECAEAFRDKTKLVPQALARCLVHHFYRNSTSPPA
ncbi:unnamed protein product [Allacma fusca]|uniref:Uncharacterized protein n=1 Tax=Allacma fusca TaxID=39272 RepID=A0A8J2P548_9HEXA|nr:unnamed protein product [Allacma fusca]